MQGDKPKAASVPFGYPGYPDSYLERFKEESVRALEEVGIDVQCSPRVKVHHRAFGVRLYGDVYCLLRPSPLEGEVGGGGTAFGPVCGRQEGGGNGG
jgi:hypothetical protein